MAIERHAEQVTDRLVDEVRWGLSRAGAPDARSSNGPFLALTILIAREAYIPPDVLLAIIDLADDHRFDLFGDSMDHSILVALSQSLLGDAEPIDQRIADKQRPDFDRGTLAMYYPFSAWRG